MTPRPGGTTVAQALAAATDRLREAGVDSPRLDAELLLAHALNTTREKLITGREDPLPAPAAAALVQLVKQRAEEREPVAYLLGRKAFRRIELHVDPRVLIPRPETEHLVEVGLELPAGARAHDVGTGSGAIALALADERPDLIVSASDVSDEALAVARENARRLGLEDRVSFHRGDLLDGVKDPADAVLANLPYVRDEDHKHLAPEITRHEPTLALTAGADGLDLIRRLVAQAAAAGVPLLALEIGEGQAPATSALLHAVGYGDVRIHRDLQGVARVLVGRAQSTTR